MSYEILRDASGRHLIPQYYKGTGVPTPLAGGDKGPYFQILDSDGNPISTSNPIPVAQVTTLSSELDSIDVNRMSKGGVQTILEAIETDGVSGVVDCSGYNALLVAVELTGQSNSTIKIQGNLTGVGDFIDCSGMSEEMDNSKMLLFKGIPDFIKVSISKEDNATTATVRVQPLNM